MSSIPPSNVPVINPNGTMDQAWYRYFSGQEGTPGFVTAGDGLKGGGPVSAGVELSLSPGGVSNANLRPSTGTSVIGRAQPTAGTPSDIKAAENGLFLGRMGDALAFRPIAGGEFAVADLPSATDYGAGAVIYVPDESGGATLAFSDGTDWRRAWDLAIVS